MSDIAVDCSLSPDSGVDPARAVEIGERGLSLVNPDIDAYTRLYLAVSYYRAGKFSQALEQLDLHEATELFGIENGEGQLGCGQVLRAMIAQREGRIAEAKAYLNRARQMQAFLGMRSLANPLDNTGVWLWGWAQFRILITEAEALIEGGERRENPWNLLLEARATAQYGLTAKARAILDNPLIGQPADPVLLAARAQVLLYLGDEAAGRPAMDEAPSKHSTPDNRLALFSKVEVAAGSGQAPGSGRMLGSGHRQTTHRRRSRWRSRTLRYVVDFV